MNTTESQVPFPTSIDACSLTDWVESLMFAEDRSSLSRASLRTLLRPRLFIDRDELEVQLDLLLSKIDRRRTRAELAYPFACTEDGISRIRTVDETPYEFLLWLAISPIYREQNRYHEIDEFFDNLVRQALIVYMGPNAMGVRFGSPASGGRPAGFPEAVKWLARLLRLQTGAAEPRPKRRDGGVDVVVWHPFRDGRTGFAVVLCQCTVAIDWTPKAKDIVPGIWNGWIDFGRDPLTAIAVPFSIRQTFSQWDELRRTVNIVLDRMRLIELIQIGVVDSLPAIEAWNNKERSHLSASN